MTDLTKINTPFGELDIETKLALHRAYYEGKVIESRPTYESVFHAITSTSWPSDRIYRVRQEPLRDIRLPWEFLHKKWQWAARDSDGSVWLFDDIPSIPQDSDYWSSGSTRNTLDLFADFDPGNKPWDQSLIKRPDGV